MIDQMVDRFLSWSLPKDFKPDGGISFTPLNHWPVGTNLLTAEQAREMIEHMLATIQVPTGENRCGACHRGDHAECSGWCFCPCQTPQEGKAEHLNTEACGFDRSASLAEDTYVCTCGYRAPRGDWHPEDTCERCGRENVTWFAPSPLWNQYARTPDGDPMLCPVCFIKAAEAAGCNGAAWKVEPEAPPAATDGFVMDDQLNAWVGSLDGAIGHFDAELEKCELHALNGQSLLEDKNNLESLRDWLAAAPQSGKKEDGWLPIETAPRDSRRIIVGYYNREGEWRSREAWWRIPYDGAPMDQGYWCYGGDGTLLSADVHKIGATHWMPLPSPPASKAEWE